MSDDATPRPWTAPTMPTDIETPPVIRHIYRDAQGRRVTRFVAEFFESRGKDNRRDAHANAILATEAVNDYDRLRAIEAAARAWLSADQAYIEADFGADEEEQAVAHVAKDALRAALFLPSSATESATPKGTE